MHNILSDFCMLRHLENYSAKSRPGFTKFDFEQIHFNSQQHSQLSFVNSGYIRNFCFSCTDVGEVKQRRSV